MLKLIIPDLENASDLFLILHFLTWPEYVSPLLTSFVLFVNVHLYSRLVIIRLVWTTTPAEFAVYVSVYEWFERLGLAGKWKVP